MNMSLKTLVPLNLLDLEALNSEEAMKKSEKELDLELIKILCILSILNDLQQESITEEFKKLSIKNVLD